MILNLFCLCFWRIPNTIFSTWANLLNRVNPALNFTIWALKHSAHAPPPPPPFNSAVWATNYTKISPTLSFAIWVCKHSAHGPPSNTAVWATNYKRMNPPLSFTTWAYRHLAHAPHWIMRSRLTDARQAAHLQTLLCRLVCKSPRALPVLLPWRLMDSHFSAHPAAVRPGLLPHHLPAQMTFPATQWTPNFRLPMG